MLYNRFGFISFKLSTGPEPVDLLGLPLSGFAPLSAAVIIVPGETYSFYLANIDPLSFRNTAIDLVDDNLNGVIPAIGVLTPIPVSDDLTQYIVKFTVPANTSLRQGYYRLRTQPGNAGALAYSNRLWLRKSGYEGSTALFSYRNRRAIGPIAYDLPETQTFRNVLRLKCSFGRTDTDSNLEQYERVTTGEKVTTLVKSHHFVPVSCPFVDSFAHEGWRTLTMHKDILVNGGKYAVKTGFSNAEAANSLGNGSFELWDLGYSAVNRC